jgi:pimeloyl-ACP methyl ester carboxylesterase
MADSSLTLDKTAVDAEDVHLEDQKPKKRFQKRTSAIKKPERVVETVVMDMRGFCGKLCMGKNPACTGPDRSPDADFHADSYVKLTHGVTAYRFIEPSTATDDTADDLPTVVLLHGLSNASYMWADVADLVCDSPQGPMARVLVFDFYGRGRSPWSGKDITLDTLVTQTKELLECTFCLFVIFFHSIMRI